MHQCWEFNFILKFKVGETFTGQACMVQFNVATLTWKLERQNTSHFTPCFSCLCVYVLTDGETFTGQVCIVQSNAATFTWKLEPHHSGHFTPGFSCLFVWGNIYRVGVHGAIQCSHSYLKIKTSVH
jgi:hypothetical protein